MTTGARTPRTWPVATAVGVLLAGAFLVLITASPVLRHYWPLLLLSAVAAALPFLVRDGGAGRTSPRPLTIEAAADAPTGDASVAAALHASGFSLAKAAASGGENDDAFAMDTDLGYVAVADGASSSFRAGEWARLLCATFLENRPLRAGQSSAWIAGATAALRDRTRPTSEWWNTEAAGRGAHAAFVGLAVVRSEQQLAWRATAVGDCVLVHLRPAAGAPIVTAFPITHSAAFPSNPALLSSVADGPPPVGYIEGSATIGDVWLLMTDELARWALRRHESAEPVWQLLVSGADSDIASAVDAARRAGDVADDDMTVVRCQLVGAG